MQISLTLSVTSNVPNCTGTVQWQNSWGDWPESHSEGSSIISCASNARWEVDEYMARRRSANNPNCHWEGNTQICGNSSSNPGMSSFSETTFTIRQRTIAGGGTVWEIVVDWISDSW